MTRPASKARYCPAVYEGRSGMPAAPRLTKDQKDVLREIIRAHPDAPGNQLAAMLLKATGCKVGARTAQLYRQNLPEEFFGIETATPAPAGAKILATRLPDDLAEPELPAPQVGPGGVIAEFSVPIRPVPWKVPTVTRVGAYKDPSLISWQSAVARAAWLAMAQRRPYEGRVGIVFAFTLADTGRTLPDLTNLIKSTEDPIQGTVIANDKAVGEIRATRTAGPENGAAIRVYALGDDTP